MTKYINKIHNIATGEVTEVEYTAAQIAEVEAALVESQKIAEAQAKAEADKTAILAKIGLTADEAKLLLS